MESTGIARPADTAAHHIVARNDKRAEEARKVLESFGININDAANGVFLPQTATSLAPGMYHPRLHTDNYYRTVNSILRSATSKEEVLEALEMIRTRLSNETFPT